MASIIWLLLAALFLFPASVVGQCVHDLRQLEQREELVTDTTKARTYIICPNKVYDIGFLDFKHNIIGGRPGDDAVYPPLPLRPNLTLKCGNNGSRSDQCLISGGHLQMDGTPIRGIRDSTVDNVVIEGFTFMGAVKHSVWVSKPGSITFRDCEWKVGRVWLIMAALWSEKPT
jgi:hypothetical protein